MDLGYEHDIQGFDRGIAISDEIEKRLIPSVDFDYDAIDEALGLREFPSLEDYSDHDFEVSAEMLRKLLEWCCAPPTPIYRGFRIGVLMYLLRPGVYDEEKTLAELSRKWGKHPMYMQLHVRALHKLAPLFHSVTRHTETGRQAMVDSFTARTGRLDTSKVPDRIAKLKIDSGFTWANLAKRLGVSGMTLWNASKGRGISERFVALLGEAEKEIREQIPSHIPITKELVVNRLVTLRKDAGISWAKLEVEMRLGRSYTTKVFRGKFNPKTLAAALDKHEPKIRATYCTQKH
jgi:transcriptional regulator with XRE-family HTH domain